MNNVIDVKDKFVVKDRPCDKPTGELLASYTRGELCGMIHQLRQENLVFERENKNLLNRVVLLNRRLDDGTS